MTTQRNEHWRAFGKEWFADHQRILLWLLNAPLIGRWFKWCLCIRACDIGHRREILEIQPHCYAVAGEHPDTLTTDFRTHPKYSKRLYYAFRPLWWALHCWDALIAEPFIPRLSFGFPTLTAYPDPDPEITSVDGFTVRESVDEVFSMIRDGNGTGINDNITTLETRLDSSTTTDQFSGLRRIHALFDTSSLGSAADLMSASLSLFKDYAGVTLGSTDIHIAGGPTGSNTSLAVSDFQNVERVSFSSVHINDLVVADYTSWPLNSSGILSIKKKNISKFSAQMGWDINNSFTGTWISLQSSVVGFFSADTSGTANDPKLEVVYTPSSGIPPPNRMRPAVFSPGIAR